jgi:uncharacterized protein with HXXEE motif
MDWIFSAFLAASVLHMVEEYFYPGGFMEMQKRLNPRLERFITPRMAIIVNGLQLILCVSALIVGRNALAFSLSIAGLVFINGLVHIGASIRVKRYAPGVITGTLVYIPLAAYAYLAFGGSGQITLVDGLISAVLGMAYQAVPISYLVLSSAMRRA